eukprot:3835152-Ditylum_brightwellii.AAC.1
MRPTGSQLCSREKSISQLMDQLLKRRAILLLSSTPNMRCSDFMSSYKTKLAAVVLTANSSTCSGLKAHLCADYDIAAEVRQKKGCSQFKCLLGQGTPRQWNTDCQSDT